MNIFAHLLTLATLALAVSVDDCPGYEATHVNETSSGITADLKLAGESCNVYSKDLHDLKLLVEFQTGTSNTIHFISIVY